VDLEGDRGRLAVDVHVLIQPAHGRVAIGTERRDTVLAIGAAKTGNGPPTCTHPRVSPVLKSPFVRAAFGHV
jgi:hypothetical protein